MSEQQPNPAPGNYYVSVVDAGRTGLLAGPFKMHAEALAKVDEVREIVVAEQPMAHFYAYGTVKMPDEYTKPGRFNNAIKHYP